MFIKFPKDTLQIRWTKHVKNKMSFYRLSESKILRTIRNYSRKQRGLAPNTICYMMRNDKLKRKEEVWVMTTDDTAKSGKMTIISTWLYPGTSKIDSEIPIPADILAEILEKFS
jgi:hypothetical protein